MTLKEARERTKTRPDRYVVGYPAHRTIFYGEDYEFNAYTSAQAQEELEDRINTECVIYELRPVAIKNKRRS